MFANSKKQSLVEHSIGVANLSLLLFNYLKFIPSTPLKLTFENINNLKENIFIAGLFHDLGKIDPNFQNFIDSKKTTDSKEVALDGVHFLEKKADDVFSFNNYPRHNELSWAICNSIFQKDSNKHKVALYAIYFHHAKVKRNSVSEWTSRQIIGHAFKDRSVLVSLVNDFISNINLYKQSLCGFENTLDVILKRINNLTSSSDDVPESFLFHGVDSQIYEDEDELHAIISLLTRTLVISADRIISSLKAEELHERVLDNNWSGLIDFNEKNQNLKNDVVDMLDRFAIKNQNNPVGRSRDDSQRKIASELADINGVSTLFGPAGCGKTKVFLEWYKNKVEKSGENDNKKLFIVAPRKMICNSLFNELKSSDYIPNSVIEIITGDTKKIWNGEHELNLDDLSSTVKADVTIITVDQLVSVMLSHKKIDMLLEFLDSYVVFDEFHEFFNIDGIVLLFKFFVTLKSYKEDSKTLLVSATPNYYFLEKILKLDNSAVKYIDTFNKRPYNFKISIYGEGRSNELFDSKRQGSIVIFNKAVDAQYSSLYSKDEDVICFHSKFTPKDRKEIYSDIMKNWTAKDPHSEKVLRAGPIVQASLNISTMNLYTDLCSSENWCQRLGRANRFASDIAVAEVTTSVHEKTLVGELNSNPEMSFLNKINMANQSMAWINYLKNEFFKDDIIDVTLSLSDVYSAYKDFHKTAEAQKAYSQDFKKTLEGSIKVFKDNDFTPFEFGKPKEKKKKSSNIQKMSAISIRGNSYFALPVRFDFEKKELGDWLYLPGEDVDPGDLITVQKLDLIVHPEVYNYQISILSSTMLINGFLNATYARNYKKMNSEKICSEARNSTSPILLSYPKTIPDYKIKNSKSLMYVNKGKLKIGLYEIS